jgi:hypothetical protein
LKTYSGSACATLLPIYLNTLLFPTMSVSLQYKQNINMKRDLKSELLISNKVLYVSVFRSCHDRASSVDLWGQIFFFFLKIQRLLKSGRQTDIVDLDFPFLKMPRFMALHCSKFSAFFWGEQYVVKLGILASTKKSHYSS